jgi:hypothetical protein
MDSASIERAMNAINAYRSRRKMTNEMNKKRDSRDASISAAIRDLCGDVGLPLNREVRDTHLDLQRAAENAGWRSGGSPGGKTLHLPVDGLGRRALAVGTPGLGGEWVGEVTVSPASDLLTWSACVTQGAQVLSGLGPDAKIPVIVGLSRPEWTPETGAPSLTSGDLRTEQRVLHPYRLSSTTQISNQLLVMTGPDVDNVILSDLGRSLSGLLDQAALYGNGIDQPTGVLSHPGSIKHAYVAADPLWSLACEMEASVANAGTGIATLGSIVSPELWRRLRSESVYGPAATGGPLISRELTRPLPTPECFNTHWFVANWSAMTIGVFSLELLINPYVNSLNGQTVIHGNLYADVCLRYPSAFSVTAGPVMLTTAEESKDNGKRRK